MGAMLLAQRKAKVEGVRKAGGGQAPRNAALAFAVVSASPVALSVVLAEALVYMLAEPLSLLTFVLQGEAIPSRSSAGEEED